MLAILGAHAPQELCSALEALGHEVLMLPSHPALPAPVADHPDMLVYFGQDALFCTESYRAIAARELELLSKKTGRPIRTISKDYSPTYPGDVLFNALPLGGRLLCRPDAVAPEVLQDAGGIPLATRQGYAKCSTLPVGRDAIITADVSIARAASSIGIAVLEIDDSAISLPGYDHGFIGGAASYMPYGDNLTVLLCGNLDGLPHADRIRAFFAAHHARLIPIATALPVRDVGTIVLI